MPTQKYIWLNGKMIKYEDATVHILTHSLQYGSGIFEGIRSFKTKKGPAIFRLKEHVKRFFNTAKIAQMQLPFSEKAICDACVDVLKKNGLVESYIRPFAYYPIVGIGLGTPIKNRDANISISATEFGQYLMKKGGLNCKISSIRKVSSSMLSPRAKFSANYMGSLLTTLEANDSGYDEGILISEGGHVAEGPAENIFIVADGALVTPPSSANILMGITRDSIIRLAKDMGMTVEERNIHREELYTCDEAFFTGTAIEVESIVSVDKRKIGSGKPGTITNMLHDTYMQVVNGEREEFKDWLTYV